MTITDVFCGLRTFLAEKYRNRHVILGRFIRRLTINSREVSNLTDWVLQHSYRPVIWQAVRWQYCREAQNFSEFLQYPKHRSHGLESLCELTKSLCYYGSRIMQCTFSSGITNRICIWIWSATCQRIYWCTRYQREQISLVVYKAIIVVTQKIACAL